MIMRYRGRAQPTSQCGICLFMLGIMLICCLHRSCTNNNSFGSVTVVSSFSFVAPSTTITSRSRTVTEVYMSEPSDTSSEDFTNEDYPGYAASDSTANPASAGAVTGASSATTIDVEGMETNQDVLVSNILDLMPKSGMSGGVVSNDGISNEIRAAINEALFKLEGLNPTKSSPAVSPLLNGVWELRYYGGYDPMGALTASPTRQLALFLYSGGYSPGLFGLYLASQFPSNNPIVSFGDVEISISRIQPRIEASIPVQLAGGSSESSIKLTATLEPASGMRLKETYESINFFGTTNIPFPKIIQYSRDLYVTYVDDDLLIVRDGSGIPEVLVRKEKTFVSQSWGTDPLTTDDVTPPGVDSSSSSSTALNVEDGSEPSY